MTALGGKKSPATRMVTRLRNPDSKLSQMKSQQVAAAVHEANKGFREGKEVRAPVRQLLTSVRPLTRTCLLSPRAAWGKNTFYFPCSLAACPPPTAIV